MNLLLKLQYVLLIVIYSMLLIHARKGSRFTFVYTTCGLLCISSSFNLLELLIDEFLVFPEIEDSLYPDEQATIFFWLASFCGIFGSISFAVAYWVIASRYHMISIEIPHVIEQSQIPQKCCKKDTFDGIIITLNAVAALFYKLLSAILYWEYIIDGQ